MPPSTVLPPCDYTIVVTSCRRFDLLRVTLRSLVEHLDVVPRKWVVVEDSSDERVRDTLKEVGIDATILINGPQVGQVLSIDRAYACVDTPYVFHCEDDWEFFRGGFIRESHILLEKFEKISLVGLRSRGEQNPLIRNMPPLNVDGVRYFVQDPKLHPEYFSYSWNPGLRRMSDYQQVGPFSAIGPESDVSYAFKKRGFSIANLEDPAVRHIGDERHVHDPTQPQKAKTFPQMLRRSIRKRWKRLLRRFSS